MCIRDRPVANQHHEQSPGAGGADDAAELLRRREVPNAVEAVGVVDGYPQGRAESQRHHVAARERDESKADRPRHQQRADEAQHVGGSEAPGDAAVEAPHSAAALDPGDIKLGVEADLDVTLRRIDVDQLEVSLGRDELQRVEAVQGRLRARRIQSALEHLFRSDRLHPHLRLLSAIPGCGDLRCGTSSAAMPPRFTGWPSSYQLLSGTSHFLPNRSAKSPRCGRPFAAVSFIALSPTTALYSHTHRYVTSGLNAAIGLECLTV